MMDTDEDGTNIKWSDMKPFHRNISIEMKQKQIAEKREKKLSALLKKPWWKIW